MANIEELQRALRQGSDAKARLSGLDEQYQQAQDRGVATTKKDRYGQVSPLSVLADVVGQSRSRRDMRELTPQREAARSNIAQHENAQGLFNAVRQQEQDNQIQANWTDGHALKLAQQRQGEAREVSRQEELAAELALESQVGKPTTVWDIETGARQDITFDPQGNPFTLTTQGLKEPFDMTGYSTTKPEKVDKNGKYGGGGSGSKDGEPLDKVGSPDLMAQILDSDYLEPATGTLDPKRWAGKFGYGLPTAGEGEGENIQALQSKMSDIGIDSVKTNLEGLGINPTDRDLSVAFSSIPDAGTQPLAWAIWTRDQYLPMLRKAGAKAIQDGTAEPDHIEQYLAQVDASVGRALTRYYPSEGGGAPVVDAYTSDEEALYQQWKESQ
jgi:hypothetical protein